MAEDDDEFEEKLAYTFDQMNPNKTGTVNYMQLRKWISAQMKEDDEVDAKGITDEMQEASTDAFAKYKRDSDDLLGLEEVADLLRALDLLKYMPEEIPEPEPEPVQEGLSAEELTRMLEEANAEIHDLKHDLKVSKKDCKKTKAELEDIYLPYKPKRRTRAMIARENGLGPLAEAILADWATPPTDLAQASPWPIPRPPLTACATS